MYIYYIVVKVIINNHTVIVTTSFNHKLFAYNVYSRIMQFYYALYLFVKWEFLISANLFSKQLNYYNNIYY
jgi:hypothetical protein